MIMEQLPTIPPGDDFDRQVLYRAWMSSLPAVETATSFDEAVLKRARKGSMSHWWGIAVIAVFLAVVGGLSLVPEPTVIVAVSRVPSSPVPLADLYDLKPVVVMEDTRFETQALPQAAPDTMPEPFGVAGR